MLKKEKEKNFSEKNCIIFFENCKIILTFKNPDNKRKFKGLTCCQTLKKTLFTSDNIYYGKWKVGKIRLFSGFLSFFGQKVHNLKLFEKQWFLEKLVSLLNYTTNNSGSQVSLARCLLLKFFILFGGWKVLIFMFTCPKIEKFEQQDSSS